MIVAREPRPAKRKVMVEMEEHIYRQLKVAAKRHERSMAAQVRYLVQRNTTAAA